MHEYYQLNMTSKLQFTKLSPIPCNKIATIATY